MKRDKNGSMKRPWYGKVFLYVPKEKWIQKAMDKGAIQVKLNKSTGKEQWRPMPRKELMNLPPAEIVSKFNSEIRGLYNFYRIAENVGVLDKYYYMARYSMLKTLAGKFRTNVSKIKKRFMKDGILRIPYETKKGTTAWPDRRRRGSSERSTGRSPRRRSARNPAAGPTRRMPSARRRRRTRRPRSR